MAILDKLYENELNLKYRWMLSNFSIAKILIASGIINISLNFISKSGWLDIEILQWLSLVVMYINYGVIIIMFFAVLGSLYITTKMQYPTFVPNESNKISKDVCKSLDFYSKTKSGTRNFGTGALVDILLAPKKPSLPVQLTTGGISTQIPVGGSTIPAVQPSFSTHTVTSSPNYTGGGHINSIGSDYNSGYGSKNPQWQWFIKQNALPIAGLTVTAVGVLYEIFDSNEKDVLRAQNQKLIDDLTKRNLELAELKANNLKNDVRSAVHYLAPKNK